MKKTTLAAEKKRSTGTGLMHSIMLALSNQGHFVDRYTVGLFWTKDGRPVKVGTAGFSDLFGHRKGDARAFYFEVKDGTGRASKEQKAFLAAMQSRGAIAGVVRSVDEAIALIDQNQI